jgi:DNA-binding LacI/PurR family transcriptional regulator
LADHSLIAKSNRPSKGGRRARYRQIADGLEQEIRAGRYRPGDRLPTEHELARIHGVSRVTVAAALGELARAGLVTRTPRRGTIVGERAPHRATAGRPLIAYVLTSMEQTYQFYLIHGIETAARAAHCGLLMAATGSGHDREALVVRQMVEAGAAGIMLFPQDGERYNAEVLRLVLEGYPLVLVDRYLRGVNCAVVSSDNVAGSRMIVRELLDAGHRSIGVLTFPVRDTSTIEDRLAGYVQALTAAGVPVDYSLHFITEVTKEPWHWGPLDEEIPFEGENTPADLAVDWRWEPPAEEVARFATFLRARPQVTALYATNTTLGLLALRAIEHLHLRIPQDLSLVCIDPIEAIPLSLPAVTVAVQQAEAIGRTAVQLLLEAIDHQPPRTVLLPMLLRRAGSVGPVSPRHPS